MNPAFRLAASALCFALLPILQVAAQEAEKNTPPSDESILTAEQFESFVSGTTLYFNRRGEPYGAEQYKPDRRVIWTFLDGRCERGAWFNEGNTICFVYETQSEAQCWNFLDIGATKHARVIGADPANDLKIIGQDDAELDCPGPGVGVSYTPAPLSIVK